MNEKEINDNSFEEFENDSKNLTDKEIFSKIWTSTREIFKFINDKHYNKYVNLLLVLAGISRAFDRASMKDMGDKMSIWAILGLCIICLWLDIMRLRPACG